MWCCSVIGSRRRASAARTHQACAATACRRFCIAAVTHNSRLQHQKSGAAADAAAEADSPTRVNLAHSRRVRSLLLDSCVRAIKWRTQVCTLCEQVAAAQFSMLLRRYRLRVELTLVRVPPDVGRCRENPKPALRVGKRRLSINVRRARKFSEKLGTESSISNNTRAGQAAQCATPNG